MKIACLIAALLIPAPFVSAQHTPKAHLAATPMTRDQRQLFDDSMQLFDASYDPTVHFLRRPHDGHLHVSAKFMIRESSWYALSLLMRHAPGDQARATAILEAVLQQQYLDPNVRWYGTFRRSPEDPSPATGDAAFTTYDPNWRHFVGTIFELILIDYRKDLSADLATRLLNSIHAAVQGEMRDGRLLPSYSNIALMYGALWDFAATQEHNAAWHQQSAAWTDEVYRLFRQHNTFNEYNAPTYYGVDLYGLALWREYGSNPHLRTMGTTMEAALWESIAQFYQPALRNMAGPYDRSYGMDMTQYVTPTGVWMRTVMEANQAPLPEHTTLTTYQVADLWFAPQIVLLQTHIPPAALRRLKAPTVPHLVTVPIDEQRTATAWLGTDATWGGEFTSRTKDSGQKTQFHPVTLHWKMSSGQIGWVKITHSPNIDATADSTGVSVTTEGDVTFRIFYGPNPPSIDAKAWQLPGMNIAVQTDATAFSSISPGDCSDCRDVLYKGVHTLRLQTLPSPAKVGGPTR